MGPRSQKSPAGRGPAGPGARQGGSHCRTGRCFSQLTGAVCVPSICDMTRRKGEITASMNQRRYPFFADVPVPEWGFGRGGLQSISGWHAQHGVPEIRGVGGRMDDRDFCRWCFADAETAQRFADTFDGLISHGAKRRG